MESEVLSLSFNPVIMVTIYRHINQLQKKATEAGIPYSEEQQIEFRLSLIRNTRYLENALGKWNALVNKAWDLFKSHFRDAQTKLKEIRGPTMQQASYHHANMLASQLRVDIGNQQTKMLSMVHQLVTGQPPAFKEEESVQ